MTVTNFRPDLYAAVQAEIKRREDLEHQERVDRIVKHLKSIPDLIKDLTSEVRAFNNKLRKSL